MSGLGVRDALAVLPVRDARLPLGASEAVAEAGGAAFVVGPGATEAALGIVGADRVAVAETGPGFRPGELAMRLASLLAPVSLVLLPASPDGRDLAPRLARALDRPLFALATRARLTRCASGTGCVEAELSRLDGRLLVAVESDGPVVATLVPGARDDRPVVAGARATRIEVDLGVRPDGGPEPELIEEQEADVATMDLAEAPRVLGGGYGLAAGCDDATAVGLMGLLGGVATRLGAALGATRVVTDAGWVDHARQVGTTGVAIDPDLYVAFGVSGASQHVGGLGTPRTVVSVNLDPSCPMTKMADLGIVTDARALVVELADRLGVEVPEEVRRG